MFQICENQEFPYGTLKTPLLKFLVSELIEMTYNQSVKKQKVLCNQTNLFKTTTQQKSWYVSLGYAVKVGPIKVTKKAVVP